jgi:RNA polymerase sigma-70 factor (ECF subfamily)
MELLSPRGAKALESFDRPYLERLRAGDGETVRHFVAYFSDLIRIKVGWRVRSRTAVEDIRQETFLRVFRALRSRDGIREPERLGAFVNSVCNHVLLEARRAGRRHGFPVTEPPEAPDAVADPEARLAGEERRALVREVIGELAERDRRVLWALYVDDQGKDEVCARLGVNRSYLRVLLHRARASFRAHFIERQPAAAGAAPPVERWLP